MLNYDNDSHLIRLHLSSSSQQLEKDLRVYIERHKIHCQSVICNRQGLYSQSRRRLNYLIGLWILNEFLQSIHYQIPK